MSKTSFVNDARVMAKGQVTIPKNVRNVLGIDSGDSHVYCRRKHCSCG